MHFTVGEAGDVDIDDFVEPVAQPVDHIVHDRHCIEHLFPRNLEQRFLSPNAASVGASDA